ncbi:adenylyl-sulfate kinase [Phytomonospora endophytica]|uniref:adenylyl-sulfate kinase n=1 Tax=Phytomonospora endophytica TaxID=714109 RepID=A0A841F8H9_9ACTN|nr:adenylyl-sulfate kinase [Phytomonospora endophytica]MBB6033391.1 sulfate adenylyltransferase [Phytomonospora endophytica]GIG70838.1 sulfate adenylyltransferase [Phytomonospora endophytica]
MSEWVLPDEVLANAPSSTPRPHELADLELLLAGAYEPLTGFLSAADVASVVARGELADGRPWPVPVTLDVPEELAARLDPAAPRDRVLVLTDPEGAPVAAVEVLEITPSGPGQARLAGPVRRIAEPEHGPFRRLRATPVAVRAGLPDGRVLGVIADTPLHRPQLAQISHAAKALSAHVLILIPIATPGPDGLPPEALVRAVLAARDRLPRACTVAAVPLAPRGDEIRDGLLNAKVAAAYGVTHLLSDGQTVTGGGLRVIVPRELGYDIRDGQWRPLDDIPPRFRRPRKTRGEIADLLDRGHGLPDWHTPPAVAAELSRSRPPRRERGLVVFCTGLSGSGKSTIARGLYDTLAESGQRTVSLLDGDVVRRLLSAGLSFSAADRDLNIRRIGYVAAEIGRHHGVAICCPIAPYAASRDAAREAAREAGADFVLVHVATPLEECERRDRKGLYAKARAGVIGSFTGISDPYEVPVNAELTIDTTDLTVDQAVERVITYLTDEGWLDRQGW